MTLLKLHIVVINFNTHCLDYSAAGALEEPPCSKDFKDSFLIRLSALVRSLQTVSASRVVGWNSEGLSHSDHFA